jgi:hypothetical protein
MSLGAASIGNPRSKSVEIVEEAKKWSGLSESNRQLNLGNSEANGKSGTYEALSGALSGVWSRQKRLVFLRLFPRNEEYRSGSDVPTRKRVGAVTARDTSNPNRIWQSRDRKKSAGI